MTLTRHLGSLPYQDRLILHGLMTQTKQTGPPMDEEAQPAYRPGTVASGKNELPKKKWCACALPGASPCVPALSSVPFRGAPAKAPGHPPPRQERPLKQRRNSRGRARRSNRLGTTGAGRGGGVEASHASLAEAPPLLLHTHQRHGNGGAPPARLPRTR